MVGIQRVNKVLRHSVCEGEVGRGQQHREEKGKMSDGRNLKGTGVSKRNRK